MRWKEKVTYSTCTTKHLWTTCQYLSTRDIMKVLLTKGICTWTCNVYAQFIIYVHIMYTCHYNVDCVHVQYNLCTCTYYNVYDCAHVQCMYLCITTCIYTIYIYIIMYMYT